jgi:hypothetical protein
MYVHRLRSVAAGGSLSLRLVDSGALLEAFLPRLLPGAWRGRAGIAWDGEQPAAAWVTLLWQKLEVMLARLLVSSHCTFFGRPAFIPRENCGRMRGLHSALRQCTHQRGLPGSEGRV